MTHQEYISYFKKIADNYISINGFFRMNLSEIQGRFRTGVKFPCLVLESFEGRIIGNKTSAVAQREFAFTIYNKVSNQVGDRYSKENNFLNQAEQIGIDIINRIRLDSFTPGTLTYDSFTIDDVQWHKVGPVFAENLFGYRFTGIFKTSASIVVDSTKWKDKNGN